MALDLDDFDDLSIQKSSIKSSIQQNNDDNNKKMYEESIKKCFSCYMNETDYYVPRNDEEWKKVHSWTSLVSPDITDDDDWGYFYAPLEVHIGPQSGGNLCDEAKKVLSIAEKCITYGDIKGMGRWSTNGETIHNWMSYMKTRVRIYIIDEKDPIKWIEPYTSRSKSGFEVDTLGCYFRNLDYDGAIGPVIFLFQDPIVALIKKGTPETLWVWVLLHELAHAMLDESNLIQKMKQKPIFDYDKENIAFRKFMEESLANYIMLQYVKAATPGDYVACKTFVEGQPKEYSLALKYEGQAIDWSFWRLKKQEIYNQLSDPKSHASKWDNLAHDPNSSPADVYDALTELIESLGVNTIPQTAPSASAPPVSRASLSSQSPAASPWVLQYVPVDSPDSFDKELENVKEGLMKLRRYAGQNEDLLNDIKNAYNDCMNGNLGSSNVKLSIIKGKNKNSPSEYTLLLNEECLFSNPTFLAIYISVLIAEKFSSKDIDFSEGKLVSKVYSALTDKQCKIAEGIDVTKAASTVSKINQSFKKAGLAQDFGICTNDESDAYHIPLGSKVALCDELKKALSNKGIFVP